MPLKLGGVETERPCIIPYNPAVAAEAKEALDKMMQLIAEGYRLTHKEEGEIRLAPPPIDPNLCFFRILSQNGDDRIVWDRRKPDEVREAFAKFKELLAKGYTAYAVLSSGKRGHKITEFDPSLEEILMSKSVKEVVMVPATMPG